MYLQVRTCATKAVLVSTRRCVAPLSPSTSRLAERTFLAAYGFARASPGSWGCFRTMDCEHLNFGVASALQLATATRTACDAQLFTLRHEPALGSSPKRRPQNDEARKRLCTRLISTLSTASLVGWVEQIYIQC